MNRIFRVFSLALSLAFLTSFAVFSLAPHHAAAVGICKVGIYGAELDASYLTDVQSKLNGTGLFTQVDVHNIYTYTPTLAELQQYSAVIVYSNASVSDGTALGNVLADYADAGGGVVVATFALNTANLSGRIASGGYLPFTSGSSTNGTPLTLIPDVSAHPILAGISSFHGGSNSWHNTISLTAGAFQVAHWSNGVPLVATKQPTTGKVVGLNFYPTSSDAVSTFWTATTDGARLMGNSLAWAGNCITADTRSVVGIYGAKGDTSYLTDVQSKLNSTGLFTRVDIHKANDYTPSRGELQQYSAVLVFSDTSFSDRIALGDVLANYADAGGGVVVAAFAFYSDTIHDLAGRFQSEGYMPFTTGSYSSGTLLTLIPDLPAHPIMAGVTSFDGGSLSFHDTISLSAGATQVAHWSNDVPLVATKQPTTGIKIVGLNFYPASSDAQPGLWTATTDGARLMGNALMWAADASAPTVTGFSAPSSSSSRNIPITSFAATDDAGVKGYLITNNATPPVAGAAGWTAAAPTDYTVAADGTYTLYPWVKDALGNVSAVYGSPATVIVSSCTDNDSDGYFVGDGCTPLDADDADAFYTDILPTCTVKIIPGVVGRLIGDREKTRSLLIIGERGTEFGDNSTIKWESDAIDMVSTRVFFKRFMIMRATFNGEPLEWKEYRVLVGACEGKIRWGR